MATYLPSTRLLDVGNGIGNTIRRTRDYFAHESWRDIANFIKIVGYYFGFKKIETLSSAAYDAACFWDLKGNIRDLTLYDWKNISFKSFTSLCSDTINNTCDSVSWANARAIWINSQKYVTIGNIWTLGKLTASWFNFGSGATLAYSFGLRSCTEITANYEDKKEELKNDIATRLHINEQMSKFDQIKICETTVNEVRLFKIATNVCICAIGVILAYCAWFELPLMIGAIMALSTITLAANVIKHNLVLSTLENQDKNLFTEVKGD